MANRYWIAPSVGKWNNTANWSTTSGGTGGASVPGSADIAIFDANSNTSLCLVTDPQTVNMILTTGYNGDICTFAPLTCTLLEWSGFRLMLAESTAKLSVKRTRSDGSSVYFGDFGGAALDKVNPIRLTRIGKTGTTNYFQFNPVPGAISYESQFSNVDGTAWTNTGSAPNVSLGTYSGAFGKTTLYYLRIRAVFSSGYSDWSIVPFLPTAADFSIDFNTAWSGLPTIPVTPIPLSLGMFEVVAGSKGGCRKEPRTNSEMTNGPGLLPSPSKSPIGKSSGATETINWKSPEEISAM